MDEAGLLEKLRKIEALHAGTSNEGEREAARQAAERIRARLAEQRSREPDIEMGYSLPDPWKRALFVALCRRYGLRPFRRYRQRASSVRVLAPLSFQQQTLWPEYLDLAEELQKHLEEITERVIHAAIHGDSGEAEETEPKALPGPGVS